MDMWTTRARRTTRRLVSVLTASALVAGLCGVLTSAAVAGIIDSCKARDPNSGATSSDLQVIIDGAKSGDEIVVQGVCTGNFTVDKDLQFSGSGQAALDGNNSGSVVTILARLEVSFKNLLITHGSAVGGGGIEMKGQIVAGAITASDSTVNLYGHAQVNYNSATRGGIFGRIGGGGIDNFGGTVNLYGHAQVNYNSTNSVGGGIFDAGDVEPIEPPVNLYGHAQVDHNTARFSGGGIFSGDVTLSGFSEVNDNTTGGYGGGIFFGGLGSLTLKDAASITGNTAGVSDGGIFGPTTLTACDNRGPDKWTGAISPNTPDDPPSVTLVAC